MERKAGNKVAEFLRGSRDGAMHLGHRIDDSTQAFVRDHVLQLPRAGGQMLEGDAPMKGVRNALGMTLFAARPGYTSDATTYKYAEGDAARAALSRAAQGGMITAAGAGLAALTQSFGGVADQPEEQQLPLS